MITVTYEHNLPFGSFDWQTELVAIVNEFSVEATVEVLKKHKSDEEIEWKDVDRIMDEVYRHDLMNKILAAMKKKYENYGNDL